MEAAKPTHLNVMFSPTYAVPIFGFVVPPLALIVLVINTLMIWTICRQNMRSPANAILICIAISDTLAICFPVSPFIYFYTLGKYKDFVPFGWCRAFFNLVHVLPLLCNMASMWATVLLAFMRCYSVWRPLRAKVSFTMSRTSWALSFIYFVSFAVYFPLMFEYSFTPITTESMVDVNATMITCHMSKGQSHASSSFCTAHTWVQILMTSLIPWFLITFPDVGLLWKLKKVEKERNNLLPDGEADRARTTMTNRRQTITWMIFIIVSMVWIVEIPFAVCFTLQLAHSNGDVMRYKIGDNVVFVYLLKYTFYPILFMTYCFMSQNFRKTFTNTFLSRPSLTNSSTIKSTSCTSTRPEPKTHKTESI